LDHPPPTPPLKGGVSGQGFLKRREIMAIPIKKREEPKFRSASEKNMTGNDQVI